jgi:hypothetical protein
MICQFNARIISFYYLFLWVTIKYTCSGQAQLMTFGIRFVYNSLSCFNVNLRRRNFPCSQFQCLNNTFSLLYVSTMNELSDNNILTSTKNDHCQYVLLKIH